MRRAIVLLVLALSLLSTAASATTVIRLGFHELVAGSQLIVHGTVTRVQVVAVGGSERRLRTQVDVAVAETLAGAPRRTLHLDFVGGSLGKWTLSIPGMPRFAVGEEVVLFLEDLGARPPSAEPRYALTGLGQAKFTVNAGPDGVRRVSREVGDAHLVERPGLSQGAEPPQTLEALLGAVRSQVGGAQ